MHSTLNTIQDLLKQIKQCRVDIFLAKKEKNTFKTKECTLRCIAYERKVGDELIKAEYYKVSKKIGGKPNIYYVLGDKQVSLTEAGKLLGISPNLICNWKKASKMNDVEFQQLSKIYCSCSLIVNHSYVKKRKLNIKTWSVLEKKMWSSFLALKKNGCLNTPLKIIIKNMSPIAKNKADTMIEEIEAWIKAYKKTKN